jgi:hypothetical protein
MRWHDPVLTWDPSAWGMIDMVYLHSHQVWRPDLMLTNHNIDSTINFASKDQTLVRVHAAQATHSDLKLFNVEWSPYINFKVNHDFDLTSYPIDTQNVKIRIESWMSLQNKGGIKLAKLSEASSLFKTNIIDNSKLDDR